MIRNLKFLGLAVVAALAMSAMVASAASADTLNTGGSSVTVTGAQEKHKEGEKEVFDKFKVDGGTVECETATYTGTATSGATTITVSPTYGGCKFTGLATTIDTTGCSYVFHVPATAGGTTGTVDVSCTAGNEITATVLPGATPRCIIHITTQSGLGTVTYKNIGSGTTAEVTVSVNISSIKYSQTAGTGVGACATADSTTNGVYEGAATVTGETDGGSTHVGI